MKITLEALAVLDAIDRRGSFAAAAAELHRVPSAITYQVRKLEDELAVALFDRHGHRARFTAGGREVLAAGRALLRGADALERGVRQSASGWEADLRIVVDALVPWGLVWPLATAFYAHCARHDVPPTRLHLTREVRGGTWDALADGRADLAVGATGDVPGRGYRTRVLARVSMVFAVAPGHPLAGARDPLPAGIIRRHRAVVAADSSRHLPTRTVGLLDGQDTLTVPDLDSKIAAQAAGLGCGFLPVHLARGHIASGRLIVKRVEEALGIPGRMLLAWRSERPGHAHAWWVAALSRKRLAAELAGAGARAPNGRPRTRGLAAAGRSV